MNLFRRPPAPHDHDDPRYPVRKTEQQWQAELRQQAVRAMASPYVQLP